MNSKQGLQLSYWSITSCRETLQSHLEGFLRSLYASERCIGTDVPSKCLERVLCEKAWENQAIAEEVVSMERGGCGKMWLVARLKVTKLSENVFGKWLRLSRRAFTRCVEIIISGNSQKQWKDYLLMEGDCASDFTFTIATMVHILKYVIYSKWECI